MSCEFCPADGSGCGVCADAPTAEVLTPAYLSDVGLGGAAAGSTLARTLWLLARDHGPLEEWHLAAVIEGHAAGATYDMARIANDRHSN